MSHSDSLPVKKIYIDSKFRRHDSVSTSNFRIDLPNTLKLPANTVFYVDDVCIPHSWHTIEAGVNDKLYVRTVLNGANTDYVLTLTVIHHLILFSFANFSFQNLSNVLLNTLFSSFFTLTLYFLGTYIFTKSE